MFNIVHAMYLKQNNCSLAVQTQGTHNNISYAHYTAFTDQLQQLITPTAHFTYYHS